MCDSSSSRCRFCSSMNSFRRSSRPCSSSFVLGALTADRDERERAGVRGPDRADIQQSIACKCERGEDKQHSDGKARSRHVQMLSGSERNRPRPPPPFRKAFPLLTGRESSWSRRSLKARS